VLPLAQTIGDSVLMPVMNEVVKLMTDEKESKKLASSLVITQRSDEMHLRNV